MSTEELLYSLLDRLDRLEELREDWLESGHAGLPAFAFDPQFRAELAAIGVATLDDLDRFIAALHAQVDELDATDPVL